MKYMKQFGLIMLVSCMGELFKYYIPLPIPASIYGLCLMMFLLVTKIVKLDQVKETGVFLIEIMPLMFIPAAVGLMVSWGTLEPIVVPVLIITLISTILVMVVSGKVTQFVIHKSGKKSEKGEAQKYE